MAFASFDSKSASAPMSEINMVPLIDVMLVLLVIFMVTAPLIAPGEIELPSVGSKLTTPISPLEITVKRDLSLTFREGAAWRWNAIPSPP